MSHRGRTRLRVPNPGTLLATTHPLAGGERVRLRLTRPSDVTLVREFLQGLSSDALHRRFFTAGPGIGTEIIRHFTFYDPRERVVVAATLPIDGHECIVGLGDLALLETGLAEIGLVVGDSRRGQGLGSLLARTLAGLGAQRGATHVKAEMLERNAAMERVMEGLGRTVRTVEDGHAVSYAKLGTAGARAA